MEKKRAKNNLNNNFNYNKKISKVIFSIIFFIFILNFLSASHSCLITTSCQSDNIVMRLSSETNAHGELALENNYNYAVCCDFPGESTDNGEDKILGLSSNTNAHAQSPELSTYSTNVYYTGLKDCRTVPRGTTHDDTEVEVVSLYSSTNSHLAKVGDYDYTILCTVVASPTKTCGNGLLETGETCDDGNTEDGDGCSSTCQLETCAEQSGDICTDEEYCPGNLLNATDSEECCNVNCSAALCDLTSANWSTINTTEGTSVNLNLTGINCAGKTISFEVWEDDLIGDDSVMIEPADVIFGTLGVWTAEWQDDGSFGGDPEYYFIASVNGTSEEITSSNQLTVTPSEFSCLEINYCSDYSEPSHCGEDLCSVGKNSVPSEITCGDGYNCGCYWDDDTPNCNPSWNVTDGVDGDALSIGDCSYIQFGDDTCDDDNFLTYSWNGTWIWATQNTFSSEDLCEESIGKTDCCFNDTIRDNKYHYDPLNAYLNCKDGEETVACPAQIKLGFFDNWNFFIVIILIFVIYYLWSSDNRKKKSFNKKKSSKRVKKKK